MQTSEILHKAADLIEERGWGTGSETWGYVDFASPLCIEGAIGAAMGKVVNVPGDDGIWPQDIQTCPAGKAVSEFLGERRRSTGWLCHWNDTRARNAAEVIEVLRGAAAVQQLRETDDAAIEEARETARGPLGDAPPVKFPVPETVGVGA